MRIWHQSMTVLADVPAYEERLRDRIGRIVRSDTEVVLHGLSTATFPAEYPGDDLAYEVLFSLHAMQCLRNATRADQEAFDAFALCSFADPMLRQIRATSTIPVVAAAESCFGLVPQLGQRFAVLVFVERLVERYREQMESYGIASRCTAITPAGASFHDVLEAFASPGKVIDSFTAAARACVAAGADVIIPAEVPLNLLLASEGVTRIDDAPVLDALAITLKSAEMMVDLARLGGLAPSRTRWSSVLPDKNRVDAVLSSYNLGPTTDTGREVRTQDCGKQEAPDIG